ncbi:hypothetical protein, partial [Tabrizicola sp.]|uniref:hypothetical protein n=1 Tax=Tabrizicola sp. TaxID=2005166 RepID=UPI0025E27AC2
MRSFDAPTLAQFQNRAALSARILVWAVARNRTTGLEESLGLWTGAQDRSFTIAGNARTYAGAGSIMEIPPIVSQSGIAVRMQRISLSPLSPEVAALIRTYDARFARIEIHRALFDPVTGLLVAEPHRLFKGIIDEVALPIDPKTGEVRCDVTMASSARYLTRTLPLKRSDATQQRRSGDRFLRYVDVSGEVDVYWG